MAYDRRRSDKAADTEETKAPKLSKLMMGLMIGASIFISVALSSIVTIIMMPASDTLLTQDRFNESVRRMDEIEEMLKKQTALSEKLDKNYEALQTHLRHSSSKALKNILVDQEQNFQSFLTILRAGMRDLALNFKDGMNWYNDYNQQMERAIQHSIQREEILQMLKVGEVEDSAPITTGSN